MSCSIRASPLEHRRAPRRAYGSAGGLRASPPPARLRSGPLHFAGGRQDRVVRLDYADLPPAPARSFLVEFGAGVEGAEAADEHVLKQLMVVFAHGDFAAVEAFSRHAFELGGERLGIIALGLVDGLGEHAHFIDRTGIEKRDSLLRAKVSLPFLRGLGSGVRDPFRDLEDTMRKPRLLYRRGTASAAGVIGV